MVVNQLLSEIEQLNNEKIKRKEKWMEVNVKEMGEKIKQRDYYSKLLACALANVI